MPLLILAPALVIGILLALLGAGGSIITVPLLVYGAGLDPHQAAGTSLLVVGSVALVGMLTKRRHIDLRTGIEFGAAGMAGAIPGAWLNHQVDAEVVLIGLAVTMMLAARRMLRGGGAATASDRGHALSIAAGLSVGFATGFFGVGGGFLIVPALTLIVGLEMTASVATSLLVIALNSAAGLATHMGLAGVEWRIGLEFAGAALIGAALVVPFARRVSGQVLQQAFALILGVAGIGMLGHTLEKFL